MTTLAEIEPKTRHRIIDLVREAGIDVGPWADMEGGEKRAAANPRYCFEWCFVEPRKLAVFNLWHGDMQEREGVIFHEVNMRAHARAAARQAKTSWVRRAYGMDRALQKAFKDKLVVRVILLAGLMRNMEEENPKASEVKVRELDETPWTITSYDWDTGDCVLTRLGVAPGGGVSETAADPGVEGEPIATGEPMVHSSEPFIDQFWIDPSRERTYRDASGHVLVRSAAARTRVLARAAGRCELCRAPGFEMVDGRVFLETHHIVPLAEGGPDTDENVAALCPNDHREAHFGARRSEIRLILQTLRAAPIAI